MLKILSHINRKMISNTNPYDLNVMYGANPYKLLLILNF